MSSGPTKLIVGIGNPGPHYTYTRHNVGFLVIQALSESYNLEFKKKAEFRGQIAKGNINNTLCYLLKPATYVNLSGESVIRAGRALGIDVGNILVVVDDVDIPLGVLKLRYQGGSGGHNGIKSITKSLGSNAYFQLRIGIGRPEGLAGLSDYVLDNFSLLEREKLTDVFDRASAMILDWVATHSPEG